MKKSKYYTKLAMLCLSASLVFGACSSESDSPADVSQTGSLRLGLTNQAFFPKATTRAVNEELYRQTVDPGRPLRRVNICFGNLLDEDCATLDLFTSPEDELRERSLAQAQIAIKEKFGKNAVFKASSLQEKATGRQRNEQVGGHSA